MNLLEFEEKIQLYRWLERISNEYHSCLDLISSNQDSFIIDRIGYTLGGDLKYFNLNSDFPFPVSYILDGLNFVMSSVDNKLEQLRLEFEHFGLTL